MVSDCNIDLDIAFLIDSSSSVGDKGFKHSLQFVKDVVKPLEFASGKTRVSVITFNDQGIAKFYLDTYTTRQDILEAIDFVSYVRGATFTSDALRIMREDVFTASQGDRDGATNIGIIITDGLSNILPQQTTREAKKAHREQIQMYGLGVGLVNTAEFYDVVSNKRSGYLVDNYDHLSNYTDILLDAICSTGDNIFLADKTEEHPQIMEGRSPHTNHIVVR